MVPEEQSDARTQQYHYSWVSATLRMQRMPCLKGMNPQFGHTRESKTDVIAVGRSNAQVKSRVVNDVSTLVRSNLHMRSAVYGGRFLNKHCYQI